MNNTDILEGRHNSTQTFTGDLIIREDTYVNASYPGAVQIMADATVTVEGGTLSCNSIRNAAILFGDDAYWVYNYDYGPHFNGTVNFTGQFATLESHVSNCITAAGIVGNNLTVSFQGEAEHSAGIVMLAGQGNSTGNFAEGIAADDSLTINGSFGGSVISLFDFSSLFNEPYGESYGFQGINITVNGDISGTIIASTYSSPEASYSYGIAADYSGTLTVNGTISGVVAAFARTEACALLGGDVNVSVSGMLFAGQSYAGKSEKDLLALLNAPELYDSILEASSYNQEAIFSYGSNSKVSYLDGAMIYGNTTLYDGSLTVSTGAFLSGYSYTKDLTIKVERNSGKTVFRNGWETINNVTIDVENAVNGQYKLAENLYQMENLTIICGKESAIWNYRSPKKLNFSQGRSISINYNYGDLTLTAEGFTGKADLEAPDISALTTNSTVHDDAALISWNGATDNLAVTGYRIRYASINSPNTYTTFRVVDPQCYLRNLDEGSYIYQIQAFDAAENTSDWSEKAVFSISMTDGNVTVKGDVPLAEYMYGCTPTATGMLLGYYDINGYKGYDFQNLIDGTVDIFSRGTDGDPYNMNAFDTALGNAIATQQYVSLFIDKTAEEEAPYTFINGTQVFNTQYYDCIAAWLGTGMAARSGNDLSTSYFTGVLKDQEKKQNSATKGFLCGLSLYVESKGYKLDKYKSRTVYVDSNNGTFTFEDYMSEIDAGRPVLIHITGHTMVGYGYNKEYQEIIFDNCYEHDCKMSWNGTYYYADEERSIKAITVVAFDTPPEISNVTISEPDAKAAVHLSFQCDEDVLQTFISFDGGDWQTFNGRDIKIIQNGTVQIRLVDASGYETVSPEYEISSFNIELDGLDVHDIPGNANAIGFSWNKGGSTEWTTQYDINLCVNGQQLALPKINGEGLELYSLSEANISWTVKPVQSDNATNGSETSISAAPDAPQVIQAADDGISEALLARTFKKWNCCYKATHVGVGSWKGTKEKVAISGKNRIADVFAGSEDTTLLYLTDDDNGDAIFIDDIFTELPGTLKEQQARIAKIDHIFAGAGDDLVDLTSQRFEYIGSGVTVHGGLGNDTIWSNKGNNILFGDEGNDRIVGASGNDIIVGGIGDDAMHGGGGKDIFCFCSEWGNDTIQQLSGGKVTLWFAEGSIDNWDASSLTYKDGSNSVSVTGTAAKNISLKFGDDNSSQYDSLLAAGAFDSFSTDYIFENRSNGALA